RKGRRCGMIDGRGKSKKDLEEREPEGSNVVGTQELLLNRNGGGAAVSGWPRVGPGTMLAVFEKIARAVVQHVDAGGDMIAVRSLIDADRFHCFYLVKERRRFFGYQYDKRDLTL
ncbi:hypothetical protein DBR06_SOUSAS8210091, partial [Sousa chinensis]